MATGPVEGQYSTSHWIETAATGNHITIISVYQVYSARVNYGSYLDERDM